MLYWLISVGMYASTYIEKINIDSFKAKKVQMLVLVLIIGSLLTTNNGYDVLEDIWYGRVQNFEKEINIRNEVLSKLENKGLDLVLTPLSNKPKSLFVLDLSKDSASWINTCQAQYYGIKTIVCKEY